MRSMLHRQSKGIHKEAFELFGVTVPDSFSVALKKDVFDSLTLAFSPLVRGAINFLKNNGNIARERADEGTSYRFVNDTL
eukprot:scaffold7366_cov199-Alexandrium_tamarense.AAC.8